MSDDKPDKNRIPFESLGEETPVRGWNLPPVSDGRSVVKSARRQSKSQAPASGTQNEAIESVPSNRRPKHLTAEELQRITEEARREGFQQGLQEGTEQGIREGTKIGAENGEKRAYTEARKDIEHLQQQLKRLIQDLMDPMMEQQNALRNVILEMVLSLTEQLVGDAIDAEPKRLLTIVDAVLDSIPKGNDNFRLYVSAEDAKLLEVLLPASQRSWSIETDGQLGRGSCRLEGQHSLVEYDVRSRLTHFRSKAEQAEAENTAPPKDYVSESETELENDEPSS